MSVFHNGLLRTMKANYAVRQKDLRVIRPFIYVREKDTRNFAEKSKLPVIPENCPACFEVGLSCWTYLRLQNDDGFGCL
jgi:tRNA(Ile)-lysidine synthase TilS/MesJ